MVLQRWSPFGDFRRMEERMNRLWRGYAVGTYGDGAGPESWGIPLDVVQEGDDYVVRASLPGVDPEDIHVTLEEDVLTIKAETKAEREHRDGDYLRRERRTGTFRRALRLPDTVDAEKAQPVYENGVLAITFPKAEGKKPRELKVQTGGKH